MTQITLIVQRTLSAVVLLLAVLTLNFLLIHAAPGDPATVLAGEMGGASAELLAEVRATYGLDQPLHHQLLTYLGRVVRGDLGQSYFYNASVLSLIVDRLWPTLLLALSALAIAIVIGIPLGIIAAYRPRHPLSHLINFVSLAGFSLPTFWLGLLLIVLFANVVPIFPVSGMQDVLLEGNRWQQALSTLHHLVLPASTLALIYLAYYSRLTRASMLEVLSADYVRTARAKGLNERWVVLRHAFRNALLPITTLVGLQFGALFSGAVVVEAVFNWPGLGTLAFESVQRRDFPTLLGILLFSTLLVIVANIVTDVLYQRLDPRLRLAATSQL